MVRQKTPPLIFAVLFFFSFLLLVTPVLAIDEKQPLADISKELAIVADRGGSVQKLGTINPVFANDKGRVTLSGGDAIKNSDVVLTNGLIAVAGDYKGIAEVVFYTGMPNTPFRVLVYDGITSSRDVVKKEGYVLYDAVESDAEGVVRYYTNHFSTQILDFPDPLNHGSASETTSYYLNYFFEDYDRVSFAVGSGDYIECYRSNFSTSDYCYDTGYSDSEKEVWLYLSGVNPYIRLKSLAADSNGFTQAVYIRAYDDVDDTSYVQDDFDWVKAAATVNLTPQKTATFPNITAYLGQQKTQFLSSYYTGFSHVFLVMESTTGNESVSLVTNKTLGECDSFSSANLTVDLCGFGSDIGIAFYANNTITTWDSTVCASYWNGSAYLDNCADFMYYIAATPEGGVTNYTIDDTLVNPSGFSSAWTAKSGIKIVPKYNLTLVRFTKVGSTTATRGYLTNSTLGILVNNSFDGNNVTIDYELVAGTAYYLLVDKSGASYTLTGGATGFSGFPIEGTNIDFTAYWDGSADYTNRRSLGVGNVTTQVGSIAVVEPPSIVNSFPNQLYYTTDLGFIYYLDSFFADYTSSTLRFNATNGSIITLSNNLTTTMNYSDSAFNLSLAGIGTGIALYFTPIGLYNGTFVFNVSNSGGSVADDPLFTITTEPVAPTPPSITNPLSATVDLNHGQNTSIAIDAYFSNYDQVVVSYYDPATESTITLNTTVGGDIPGSDSLVLISELGLLDPGADYLYLQAKNITFNTVVTIEVLNAYGSESQSFSLRVFNENIVVLQELPDVLLNLSQVTNPPLDVLDYYTDFSGFNLSFSYNGTTYTITTVGTTTFNSSLFNLQVFKNASAAYIRFTSKTAEFSVPVLAGFYSPTDSLYDAFVFSAQAWNPGDDAEPGSGEAVLGGVTSFFDSLFPTADSLTFRQKMSYVAVVMLLVAIIVFAITFSAGAVLAAYLTLFTELVLFVYFMAIGYIPVVIVLLLALIGGLIVYAIIKKSE